MNNSTLETIERHPCINFNDDGVPNYLDISTHIQTFTANNVLTVCFWIFAPTDYSSSFDMIFSVRDPTDPVGNSIQFFLAGLSLWLKWGKNPERIRVDPAIVPDTWTHFIISFGSATDGIKIYRTGIQVPQNSLVYANNITQFSTYGMHLCSNFTQMRIGSFDANYAQGLYLSEYYFFDRYLTDEEASNIAIDRYLDVSLLHLQLSESIPPEYISNNVILETKDSRTGALVNTDASFIDISSEIPNIINNNKNFTMSFWFYIEESRDPQYDNFISLTDNTGVDRFQIFYHKEQNYIQLKINNTLHIKSTETNKRGVWTHMIISTGQNGVHFYKNGRNLNEFEEIKGTINDTTSVDQIVDPYEMRIGSLINLHGRFIISDVYFFNGI
jgi:hypothetical protein